MSWSPWEPAPPGECLPSSSSNMRWRVRMSQTRIRLRAASTSSAAGPSRCFTASRRWPRQGFTPDVILAHPGWGETLPLRTMFPKARLIVYCEFFYGAQGRDLGFDAEFPEPGLDGHIGLQLKNATTLLALADADLGISPTKWQHSTFPSHYQSMIQVVHEGVDTRVIRPDAAARLRLPDGRELSRERRGRHVCGTQSGAAARVPCLHARASRNPRPPPACADRHYRRRGHLVRPQPA